MHKKHYVASEQEAQRVLSRLNIFLDTRPFIFEGMHDFDYYEDMFSTSIVQDEIDPNKRKRAITFVRKKGEFPFAVKVVVAASTPDRPDRKEERETVVWWIAEMVIIGELGRFWPNRYRVVKSEHFLWTYPHPKWLKKIKSGESFYQSLKDFISKI